MPGTKFGGLKAAETNKKKHGADFYARIGAIGGKNGTTGGFASNHTLAQLAGAKGGRKSKRGKSEACTERIRQAKWMRNNGKTIKVISETLGVTQATIHRYLAS